MDYNKLVVYFETKKIKKYINKLFPDVLTDIIFEYIFEDIKYLIYYNGYYYYMNWYGKYTMGSTFFRGTRVIIKNKYKLRLEADPDYLEYSVVKNDLSKYNDKLTTDVNFWGEEICLDDLKNLIDNTSDEGYRISDDIVEDIFNKYKFVSRSKKELEENLSKFIKPDTKILYNIYDGDYSEIYFIKKYDEILKELKHVRNIGELFNVTYKWI